MIEGSLKSLTFYVLGRLGGGETVSLFCRFFSMYERGKGNFDEETWLSLIQFIGTVHFRLGQNMIERWFLRGYLLFRMLMLHPM